MPHSIKIYMIFIYTIILRRMGYLKKFKKISKQVLMSRKAAAVARVSYCVYEAYAIYSNPFRLLQYVNVFNVLLLIKDK